MKSNYYYFQLCMGFIFLFFCNHSLLTSQQGQQSDPVFYGLSNSSIPEESSCNVVQWVTNGLAKVVCSCTNEDSSGVDDQVQEYMLHVSVQDRIKNIELALQQQNKK